MMPGLLYGILKYETSCYHNNMCIVNAAFCAFNGILH